MGDSQALAMDPDDTFSHRMLGLALSDLVATGFTDDLVRAVYTDDALAVAAVEGNHGAGAGLNATRSVHASGGGNASLMQMSAIVEDDGGDNEVVESPVFQSAMVLDDTDLQQVQHSDSDAMSEGDD